MPSSHTTPADTPQPILPIISDPPVKISLKLEDWVSVAILVTLALITMSNVLVRYFSNSSFAWTEEISVFLLIVLTMTAGSSAFVRNQHIRIELFADGGSSQRQYTLALVANVVVLLFFVLLTVLSARMLYDDYQWQDTSPAIGIPNWWYTMWMPILSLLISLRLTGVLLRLKGTRK